MKRERAIEVLKHRMMRHDFYGLVTDPKTQPEGTPVLNKLVQG